MKKCIVSTTCLYKFNLVRGKTGDGVSNEPVQQGYFTTKIKKLNSIKTGSGLKLLRPKRVIRLPKIFVLRNSFCYEGIVVDGESPS